MKYKIASLPNKLLNIIENKGTEYPFTGQYNESVEVGTYLCRKCGLALYRSDNKFLSHCGWPSFDAEIKGAILHEEDSDGVRMEILCSRCKAHLGHVFIGENLTPLNIRHCVNSSSLDFILDKRVLDTEEAIVSAGCFWGVEYYYKKLSEVLKVEVGYTGGDKTNPTYAQICDGNSGHLEAIRIVYDPTVVSYRQIIKYFFEIHDFTQTNGQGPDVGEQYLSACFYYNDQQKNTALSIISQLIEKGYKVATKVLPVSTFWPAEDYHQNYYQKNSSTPYCHTYTKIFDKNE